MEVTLDQLSGLPREHFFVTLQGKLVEDWSTLQQNDHFRVHLRILGGKGGFGSLLRSFGSQFYKSTNQDMCRDLSGRRLKDVKEEERLKKYISKASQREQEKQRKLDEKYKKLKQLDERKHEFNDVEYGRQMQRILEETQDALQEGLKAIDDSLAPLSQSDEPGTSGVSSDLLGKRKRDDGEGTSSSAESTSSAPSLETQPKSKKAKKSLAAGSLWLGIEGLSDADLDSSESESEDNEQKISNIVKTRV